MDRLVVFTDLRSLIGPTLLVNAIVRAVRDRDGIEIAGVCVDNPQPYGRLLRRFARMEVLRRLKQRLDTSKSLARVTPRPLCLPLLSRRDRFPVLVPPSEGINHPGFLRQLEAEVKPTVALSLYCMRRFGPALLDLFEVAVNYHNGLLPSYRGLMATSWSLYHLEEETGFTFHRMNENFDEGQVLLQESIPVHADSCTIDLNHHKAVRAAAEVPRLLEMIVRRVAGYPQDGIGSYYSRRDFQEVTKIAEPERFTSAELSRRLRAFDLLRMRIDGDWHQVTQLAPIGRLGARPTLSFRTRDGVLLRPTRIQYLPTSLHRLLGLPGRRRLTPKVKR